MGFKKSFPRIILSILSILIFSLPLEAKDYQFNLAEINPLNTDFNVYHSFKHKFLLISLINKSINKFDCQPNRYLIYQYRNEKFTELFAGDLRINNSFTLAFYTKIRTIGGFNNQSEKFLKSEVKTLINEFRVSAKTLESARNSSKDNSRACWQQAAVFSIKKSTHQKLPYLVANKCKKLWCSDFFWKKRHQIQFWSQLVPGKFHLVRYNLVKRKKTILGKNKIHYSNYLTQENVPRKNLVTAQNKNTGEIFISKKPNREIKLIWKKQKNGNIEFSLVRNYSLVKTASRHQKKGERLLLKNGFHQALKEIRFAEWLNPHSSSIKFSHMKILGKMQLSGEVFNYLNKNFSGKEKYNACKFIQANKFFSKLKNSAIFVQNYQKNCFLSKNF